ncbi:type II toxin-antitoxin system VapB15 family antitoxin [Pseudanabaena minima]|uniref:type II toxin-antitoxin system VapB15 family antitoxin n=1 Tax=Pseudanabaena minima TaxID=890415 RepID=UPI003DA98270
MVLILHYAQISQCNVEEKINLLKLLKEDIFSLRFKKFLNSVQTDELSLEDITNEVEAVRQANYHA